MEGTPTGMSQRSESMATAALTLGIIALPAFILVVPGLLALVLGVLSRTRSTLVRKPISGAIGALLGALSLAGAAVYLLL